MTNVVDVCFTPELLHLYPLKDFHVVVVDVLRATSNMVAGLHNGVHAIKPVSGIDECWPLKEEGFLLAGERNGLKVEGFDMGNSPFEFIKPEFKGKKIAMSTTNGTRALNASKSARKILVGSFLNFSATKKYLEEYAENVLILCAGWKGKANIEDTLFAGKLVSDLSEYSHNTDEPSIASALFLSAQGNLLEIVKESSHFKRLSKLHVSKDVEFCLQIDSHNSLIMLEEDGFLRKVVD